MLHPKKTQAEHFGLKKGARVYVVTKPNGARWLYLYETGASWFTNKDDVATVEPWDGIEDVSFYNGD